MSLRWVLRRIGGALVWCAVAAAALMLLRSEGRQPALAAAGCTPGASWAYAAGVGAAVRSGPDRWGNRLLAAPGGPSYDAAHRLLAPLLFATQRGRRPLTSSGVYYLPLAYPTSVYAPTAFALHLADGSEILSRRIDGPRMTIYVGAGGHERYGSCLRRTVTATLADGYLPVVETSYTDAAGVSYQEESFAARIPGASSIVSLVRLTIDAQASDTGAAVRFVTSTPRRLIVEQRGPVQVAAGEQAVVYAGWLHRLPPLKPLHIDERTYDRARATAVRYWQRRLGEGAQFVVPEERVMNAERALLIQQLVQGWRYSIGNPYEELSFAEALDTAEVMAAYGYHDAAESILRMSLDRLPRRFTAWRAGEQLLGEAVYFQLFHDRRLVRRNAARLGAVVAALESRQIVGGQTAGRLEPEPLSSDVPAIVDGLPAQVVGWQGLLAMSRVWSVTGEPALARRARAVALPLYTALRRAVRETTVKLPDGSLFVPAILNEPVAPYRRITSSRAGSYWNLVMPYALASGFFPPGGSAADGILRYLLGHGSRLLGVTRADAHIAYPAHVVGDGLGQVYGLNVSRFMADNDVPDQLVLSLYGMLAVAMTPDTFVSGEAISVLPLGTTYYRTMYMPPNLGANSTFLETLRLMLVHERRGPHGTPAGLDLSFATPRAWLRDGAAIRVERARTSFGTLSYSIARAGSTVEIVVKAPRVPKGIRLRVRLPVGERLRNVRAGGRRVPFDARTSTILVPQGRGTVHLLGTVTAVS